MKCPACGLEFKSPVAQAGGRAGGAAKVAKGFAVAGQPDAAARKRGWKTRKARAQRRPNAPLQTAERSGASLQADVVLDFEYKITPHILRNWDRERIVRFAKHLLGDECQDGRQIPLAETPKKR